MSVIAKLTTEQRMSMSRNGKASNARRHALGFYSSQEQSRRRLAQIESEQKMATCLQSEGYVVFSPTVVCDRIAVKDGRLYFVEFKKHGQQLRPGQQTIRDLMPENYLIRYE
jgi:hypothetical protein